MFQKLLNLSLFWLGLRNSHNTSQTGSILLAPGNTVFKRRRTYINTHIATLKTQQRPNQADGVDIWGPVMCVRNLCFACVGKCTVPMSVCVWNPYPCTLSLQPPCHISCCRAGLLEAYVTRNFEVSNFFFFISQCHTRCTVWPSSPIPSLPSWDCWEDYPSVTLSFQIALLTFFFSFFSSFFVKRVWTHQILVNMLP